nr:alpha-amylase family glycosyl hydrolase [Listeria booriae]
MVKWWQETVFYEIYMPSFKDGNGDGIGDFKGLREKIPYLAELGIGGVWLTPFYPSPKVDNGYDVSDYYAVDADFGTMADLEAFIAEAHAYGIRVIADMVVNHVSTEHAWFKEARLARDSPKRDWFVWQDTPNNWESFFGGSAWEWDASTEQYYYHSFAKEQVDLNWRNEEVVREIWNVFDFWLGKGLDGFRLDVINNLTLTRNFPDNPVDANCEQVHIFDKDQPGMDAKMAEIGAYIRGKGDYFTVGEISSDKLADIEKYAGTDGLDVTFNFNFGSVASRDGIVAELSRMQEVYTDGRMPTLFFGSHDMSRSWNRLADGREDVAQMLAMLMLTAPGVPFVYFGEELGMADFVPESVDAMRDVQGIYAYDLELEAGRTADEALRVAQDKTRDKARAPMCWPEGFSQGATWIDEVPPDFERGRRLFTFYQALIALRKTADFCEPGYRAFDVDGALLTYVRGDYLVCLNFGEAREMRNRWANLTEILANQSIVFDAKTVRLPENAAVIFKVGEQ